MHAHPGCLHSRLKCFAPEIPPRSPRSFGTRYLLPEKSLSFPRPTFLLPRHTRQPGFRQGHLGPSGFASSRERRTPELICRMAAAVLLAGHRKYGSACLHFSSWAADQRGWWPTHAGNRGSCLQDARTGQNRQDGGRVGERAVGTTLTCPHLCVDRGPSEPACHSSQTEKQRSQGARQPLSSWLSECRQPG